MIITSDALPSAKSKANYVEYISAPPFTILPIRTSFSSSVGFSRQVSSTQRIVHRHSFICSDVCSVTLATAMSSPPHPYASLYSFPVSYFLAAPFSASFSQYVLHLSSVHDQTISVLPLVFSLQPVPPALSL